MSLSLQNLDGQTRRMMFRELDYDIGRGQLYLSPYLTETGRRDYEGLLRAAIQVGNEVTFGRDLACYGRIGVSPEKLASRSTATVVLPASQISKLAEAEFHRYYARALCRRALVMGMETLEIYVAGDPELARSGAARAMIGQRITVRSLLEDLRSPARPGSARSLPACLSSGLGVRLATSG